MPCRWFPTALLFVAVYGIASLHRAAADEPRAVNAGEFFEKSIRPVLVEHCIECHGAKKKPKAGLRLDSREAILAGGESGPAVVPGKPADSLLIKAIHYKEKPMMPPSARLTPVQVAALTRWVE